jgi:soluble lytic murein transglycosylase-like protein
MTDFSTVTGRLALVTPIALKYGLEPSLVAAVCEQESEWEPGAVRFEPAFLQRYIAPMKLLSFLESLDRSTSWGLMQIMGQTAKEFGYAGDLPALRDPATAVIYGCKKLQKCFLVHGDRETALLAYNGGSNHLYPQQVIARIAHYTNV